jgi:hypothetical protein
VGVASFSDENFAVAAGVVSVKDGGITNAELKDDSIIFGDGTNTTERELGDTIKISGYTDTGLNCTVPNNGDTFTISNSIATTTSVGVAKFSSENFEVTEGVVSVRDDGITNAELEHDSLSITADTTENIPLGGTLTIKNGSQNTPTVQKIGNEVIVNTRSVQIATSGVQNDNMQISIGNIANNNNSKDVYIEYQDTGGSTVKLQFVASVFTNPSNN